MQKSQLFEKYFKNVFYIFFCSRNLFPENIISLLFMSSYSKTETIWPSNISEIVDPNYVPKLRQATLNSYKPNMIGISVISFLLGLLLKSIGPQNGAIIRGFLFELRTLVRKSFEVLLHIMPIGMFCWMFGEGLKMNSISSVAFQLVYFFTLVTSAYTLWYLIFYPLVYFVFTRKNVFRFYQHLLPAILVALGTTSSAITLPVTMKCMEGKQNFG